jgi:hypothetical protein
MTDAVDQPEQLQVYPAVMGSYHMDDADFPGEV